MERAGGSLREIFTVPDSDTTGPGMSHKTRKVTASCPAEHPLNSSTPSKAPHPALSDSKNLSSLKRGIISVFLNISDRASRDRRQGETGGATPRGTLKQRDDNKMKKGKTPQGHHGNWGIKQSLGLDGNLGRGSWLTQTGSSRVYIYFFMCLLF